ncbi:hypothetical protein [Clostridium beijerinckii]|uniref:hypothetical protein n=1 Tax=Clostridium beijerinckii TaxID=1520 RepID=UPI00156F59DA|nr:hypothetical protein [Clostridium beijerinckii]NRT71025.1 hypothetical protein [Clostridium beijerinckii]
MKNPRSKSLYILVIILFIVLISAFSFFRYSNSNPPKGNSDLSNNESQDSSYYKSLYGTWTIEKHIPSNIKTTLSESTISLCIVQKFTIEKDKISSIYGTVSDPTINEGTITATEFYSAYNDTFKNLGILGDKIKYIKITQPEKTTHSATLFITDDQKVYALLGGALFELKKQ